jgi:HEAT repeat protein
MWSLLEKSWGRSEFEIGDSSFDRAFLLGGSPTRLLALLDADIRATLSVLQGQGRLQIQGGTVAATYDEAKVGAGYDRLLAQMISVAKRLGADTDVPAALAANARREPVAAVRLKNLMALIRDFSEHEVVAETVAAALGDSVPEIRLRAAMAAREAGHPVLIALAEDPAIDDECAAAAIAALGRRLDSGRAETILRRALRTRRLETAVACVEAMGAGGAPESVPTLRKVAAVERDRLAVGATRALARVATPAAEVALREALGRDLAEVRIAAAEGLGRIGSVDSVPALRETAARHADDKILQGTARQAIAEIHARLPGASPGQLSLAAAGAGQLSLATAGGELSLAGSEAGQLSLLSSRLADSAPSEPAPGRPNPSRRPQ